MAVAFQSQYATIAQLQTLSITAAAATRFGDDSMNAALQRASSIADTYLSSQFDLPLTGTDVSSPGWDMALTGAVCDIAAYLLYAQWGGGNPASPEDARRKVAYDNALAWLKQIRDEEIFPLYSDSSGNPVGTDEAGPFIISDYPVGFTPRGVFAPDALGETYPFPLPFFKGGD